LLIGHGTEKIILNARWLSVILEEMTACRRLRARADAAGLTVSGVGFDCYDFSTLPADQGTSGQRVRS
jgi:hypothetical protein